MLDKTKAVIGTWSLSGDLGYVDLKTIQETLDYCYEKGFREFDTAPSYGEGFIEFCLGKLFSKKEDVLINTKVGNIPFKGKSFKIEDLKESFEQSLKRLNRKSINVLFLHNPRDEAGDFLQLIEFLEKLKEENRIKYSGISLAKNYDYSKKVDLAEFDIIQDDANLLSMKFLDRNFPSNSKFMARSPLASGILSGNLNANSRFEESDYRASWLKGERLDSILKRVEAIKKISDLKLPSLAKRFILHNNNAYKVIFGVKNKSHVDSIIEDLDSIPLEKEVQEKLIKLYQEDFGLINQRHLGY